MNTTAVHRMSLPDAQMNLAELCRQATSRNRRVEIHCGETDEVAVLISRDELATLEQALAIFAGTDQAVKLHQKVSALCELLAEDDRQASRQLPHCIAIKAETTIPQASTLHGVLRG